MNVDLHTSQSLNVLSLCTGAGALDLGLRLALPEARTVCAVEIEAYACEILASRMEAGILDAAPIWTDLKSFNGAQWRGAVDIVIGGYPCFVAGTMVLTREGYRAIESVGVGDLVLSHTGQWRPVTATMRKSGALVRRICAQGVPGVVCTDEHPFYTQRGWVAAKDIVPSVDRVSQILPPERYDINGKYLWLIGRYLADGYRQCSPSQRGKGKVVFCIGKQKAAEFEERLAAADLHAYKEETRTVYKYHVCRRFFYKLLEQFKGKAHEKGIPGVILELPPAQARELLEGYLSGDGHASKGVKRCSTTSKALAFGIALLAQRAYGVVASIRFVATNETTSIEGRTVNQRPYWTVDIPRENRSAFIDADGYGWKLVRENEECGTADVYNIAVDVDESYIADGAIVHNCQPFSVAGRRQGEADPRHLWPHIARIIREVQPNICFFENVANHLNLGFREVAAELQDMGYAVAAGLFTAEEIGNSHKRERLFILAHAHNKHDDGRGNAGPRRRAQFADLHGIVEHPANPGRRPLRLLRGGGEPRPDTEGQNDGGAGVGGASLGHTNEPRLQGRSLNAGKCAGERPLRSSGTPFLFPPFRTGDDERWLHTLSVRPDLAPALEPGFRSVADGMALVVDECRSDQLRLGGNGVVPLVAAKAFLSLAADMEEYLSGARGDAEVGCGTEEERKAA